MNVRLRLFALAKERAGRAELDLELRDGATVAELKRAVAERYPELAPLMPNLLMAVNAEYAADEMTVPPGAEVAAIPPVSGGTLSGPEA